MCLQGNRGSAQDWLYGPQAHLCLGFFIPWVKWALDSPTLKGGWMEELTYTVWLQRNDLV